MASNVASPSSPSSPETRDDGDDGDGGDDDEKREKDASEGIRWIGDFNSGGRLKESEVRGEDVRRREGLDVAILQERCNYLFIHF